MRSIMILTALATLGLALTGCGVTGDLNLPSPSIGVGVGVGL